jgi:hypothetical protein
MNFKFSAVRYAIVTKDEKQILVGQSRKYHFVNVNEINNGNIHMFFSEKKAKISFDASWSDYDYNTGKRISNWKKYKIIKLKVDYNQL